MGNQFCLLYGILVKNWSNKVYLNKRDEALWLLFIDYCANSKFFILHDKSPVEARFPGINNIMIRKKYIKIVELFVNKGKCHYMFAVGLLVQ